MRGAVELGIAATLLFAGCKGVSPDSQPPRTPITAPPNPNRIPLPTVEATVLGSVPQSIRENFPGIETKVPLQVIEVGTDVKVNVWNYSAIPVDAKAMTGAIDTVAKLAQNGTTVPLSILTPTRDIYQTSVRVEPQQPSSWTFVMVSPTMSLPKWAGIHLAGTVWGTNPDGTAIPKFTFAQVVDADTSNKTVMTEICQGTTLVDPNSITSDMVRGTRYSPQQLLDFTKEGVCNLAVGEASSRRMNGNPFSELQGRVMPAGEWPVAVYGSRLGADFYSKLPSEPLFQRR